MYDARYRAKRAGGYLLPFFCTLLLCALSPRARADTVIDSISSSTADGAYSTGATINVTLQFSEAVTLAGSNLLVELDTGATVQIAPFAATSTVAGTYAVGVGENSVDLTVTNIVLGAGATLRDGASNDVDRTLPAGNNLADSSDIVVDTAAPTIAAVTSSTADGFYSTQELIDVTLTFSEEVTLSGGGFPIIGLPLNSGGFATYTAFSSQTTREASYEVAEGENSPRLAAEGEVTLSGELRDNAGNSCILALPPVSNFSANYIVVDTTDPSFLNVQSVDSGGVFRAGDDIDLRLVFNDAVTGNVTVCFGTGGSTNLTWTTPVSVVTNLYVPVEGENSTNLTVTNVTGYVKDRAGNDRVVSSGGPYPLDLDVDTVAPTIDAVWSSAADGSYTTGAEVNVSVEFSEMVTLVGGELRFGLDSYGSVAVTNCVETNLAYGTYAVGAGQNSEELAATNVLLTSGADALVDAAGNPVVLALPVVSNFLPNAIVIDTERPNCTINRFLGANPTNADTVRFELVFDEPVNGLLPAGVAVVAAGTSGSVADVVPSAASYTTTYTVTVANVQGDGVLGIRVPALNARDRATNGNRLSSTSAPACLVDNTLLGVTVEQAPGQGDPTNASPIVFVVRFTEPVEAFTNTHVSLAGTANPTTAQVTPVAGRTNYQVAVSGMTEATGTVAVSVGAARVRDLAGNTNSASTSVDAQVTYDIDPPVNTIHLADASPSDGSTLGFWIETGEQLRWGIEEADIAVHTGDTSYEGLSVTAGMFGGPPYYHYVDVWGVTGTGELGISVLGGRVRDIAGNANAQSAVVKYGVDDSAPVPGGVVVEGGVDWTTNTALRVCWSNFVDQPAGIAGYYYGLTNNAGTTNGTYTTDTTGVVAVAAYGTNCVYVWAADTLGHIGLAGSDTVDVASSAEVVLDVVSAHGVPVPAGGTYTNQYRAALTNAVSAVDTQGTTRYVCSGWRLAGQQPATGATNEMTMTHVANASLVWQWTTNYWLDTAANGSGDVTPGDRWVDAGSNLTVAALAAPHHHFVSWAGSGTGAVDDVFSPTATVAMTAPVQLTADFDIDRHTLRVASDHGSPYSPVVVYTNAYGTLLTNAVGSPDEHGATQYVCAGWALTGGVATNGATSGDGTSTALEVTNDTELVWTWRTNYYLGVTTIGEGSVDVTDGWKPAGSGLLVTAQGDEGSRFAGWSGDTNGCQILGDSILVPMDAGRGITAEFVPELLELSVLSERGMAMPATGVHQLAHGTNLTCEVTGSPVVSGGTQHVCVGWTGLGSVPASGDTTNVAFTLTSNSVLSWNWRTDYRLELTPGAGGTLDVADGWFPAGSRVGIVATPEGNYDFLAWSGDTNGCLVQDNRIEVPVDAPRSISAGFELATAPRGTPCWWLIAHGITNDFAVAETNDMDGDGMLTWKEYVANTVPTNAASVLKLVGIVRTGDGRTKIAWQSASNRWYSIYRADGLLALSLVPVATNVSSAGAGTTSYTTTNAAPPEVRYYRVSTRLPE